MTIQVEYPPAKKSTKKVIYINKKQIFYALQLEK